MFDLRPKPFSKLRDPSRYRWKIIDLVDSRRYEKLRRFGIDFICEDNNNHNCAQHIGVLLGLYEPDSPNMLPVLTPHSNITLVSPEDDCLVIYHDKYGMEKHFGLYRDNRVISKWGAGPNPVFSHTIESFQYVYHDGPISFYEIDIDMLKSYLPK